MVYKKTKMLIIGHRGARKYLTENTLKSIFLAYKYGCNYAEVDVRKTKDNKLVLFHDPITFRFNKKFFLIKNLLFKDLKNIKFSKREKITLLEEVFKKIKNTDKKLVIEIKVKGIEKEILLLIDKYNCYDQILIWSFNHQIIKKINQMAGKKIKKAILLTFFNFLLTNKQILKRVKETGADYIFPVCFPLNIDFFLRNKVKVIRMINDKKKAINFINQGGTGIITTNMKLASYLFKNKAYFKKLIPT